MEIVATADDEALARLTGLLDAGELAILPLDGSYALAGDALSEEAALRLYAALDRSADQALPVVVGGFEDIAHVAFATPLSRALADDFWPGPLAMLLRARPWVPDEVTAAGENVAVVAPAADITRRLARHFGPIAVAPLDARDAARARSLAGASARALADAGPRAGGAETLVDAMGVEAKVLREGALRAAEVERRGR